MKNKNKARKIQFYCDSNLRLEWRVGSLSAEFDYLKQVFLYETGSGACLSSSARQNGQGEQILVSS